MKARPPPCWSHGSGVLDAGLGGDVGPGQQRAQQSLGVPEEPLRDGAGAQAGQRRAQVLDVVRGQRLRRMTRTFSVAAA